jgi:tetratricopeptide (TPR) repeat protein
VDTESARIDNLLLALGKAYLEKKNYSEAYAKLSQLVERNPESPEANLYASYAAMGLEATSAEALSLYESTLSLNPKADHLLVPLAGLLAEKQIDSDFAKEVIEAANKGQRTENIKIAGGDEFRVPSQEEILLAELSEAYESDGEVREPQNRQSRSTANRVEDLEALWWKGEFDQALSALEEPDFSRNGKYARNLALTHAYSALSQNGTAQNEVVTNAILQGIDETDPAKSLEHLRQYLTLHASLGDDLFEPPEPKKSAVPEMDEFSFILGQVPMDDFLCRLEGNGQLKELPEDRQVNESRTLKLLSTLAIDRNPGASVDAINWTALLALQLKSRQEIPAKLIGLIQNVLDNIDQSVLLRTGDGYLSIASESESPVEAAKSLLRNLENYNRAVPEKSRLSLIGALNLRSSRPADDRTRFLRLSETMHLLKTAEQIANQRNTGVLVVSGDPTAMKHAAEGAHCLINLQDVRILPGTDRPCAELIWRNPLMRVSKETPYVFPDVALEQQVIKHHNYITFSGTDKRLSRPVVVKVMPNNIAGPYFADETELERLYERVRAVARLEHPNIASIFHLGEQEYMVYFAMEKIDGRAINECTFEGENWENDLLGYLLKLVNALLYAESKGVHHLNLKASNVWLTETGELKLSDFRIPGFIDHSAGEEILYPARWKYLAPEVLEGKKVDVRSDIYSVGIIAYELIAQRHPYDGAGKIAEINDLYRLRIEDLEDTARPHSAKWNELIMQSIRIKPAERFQSLREVQMKLRELQLDLLNIGA